MKITIRVEITTDWDETDTFEICELERPYRQLEPEKIGLSLAERKDVPLLEIVNFASGVH
ncbi:hypothetical protein FVF58_44275 [Paraburkholderia panacisoli]|uniref:Uncharacterized protein n=1 Tax=Paraburkholderia panacisoli TaxID=2603818 RepID=A0A5B0G532_9BURK|nr:hypothetical protein [Paraburkholderia panacisoli]KAA0998504.1 hypothetical protein FVF58_44275 [Paraburkholderia panacisoli]